MDARSSATIRNSSRSIYPIERNSGQSSETFPACQMCGRLRRSIDRPGVVFLACSLSSAAIMHLHAITQRTWTRHRLDLDANDSLCSGDCGCAIEIKKSIGLDSSALGGRGHAAAGQDLGGAGRSWLVRLQRGRGSARVARLERGGWLMGTLPF